MSALSLSEVFAKLFEQFMNNPIFLLTSSLTSDFGLFLLTLVISDFPLLSFILTFCFYFAFVLLWFYFLFFY